MKKRKIQYKLLSIALLSAVFAGGGVQSTLANNYLSLNNGTGTGGYQTNAENLNYNAATGNGALAVGKATASRPDSVVVTNGIYDEGSGGWFTLVGNKFWIHQAPNDIGMTVLGSDGSIEGAGLIYLGYGNSSQGPANFIAGNKLTVNGTAGENVGIIMTKLKDDGSAATRDQGIYGTGNVGIGSGVLMDSKTKTNGTYPAYGIAIGYDTKVYAANNGIAIGRSAYNYTQGGIALGSDSYTTKDGTYNGEMIKEGYNPATQAQPSDATWQNTLGELSLGKYDANTGKSSISRRIANVAAGVLDGDAVNVAQLKAVELKVKDDKTGTPNTAYLNLKQDTLQFKSDKNITATVDGTGKAVTHTLKADLTGITSITNNDTTKTNGTKITFGDDALTLNTKKISGLADGDLTNTSTDAVTGKQLITQGVSLASALGGQASISTTNGAFTQPQYNLYTKDSGEVGTAQGKATGGQYTTVGDALTALDKGIKKLLDDGLQFSDGTNNITSKLGKKVTIEASGTTDADKLITVSVASDNQDGAKFSLGIDTNKLTTKLATGTIENGNTNLVTGGTVFTALSQKVDTTTYNTAMGNKLDTSKAKFNIAGDTAGTTAEINLNSTNAPTLQIKGDGEAISVALEGSALKVSANTVKTDADLKNNANTNKLVTASGLTSYAEANYAKLDGTNLLDAGKTTSTVSEENQKNWGKALSKDANIDLTANKTKGILVTDTQVGAALDGLKINYKYNTETAKSVKLTDGFTFKVGDGERDNDAKPLKKGLAISVADGGVVTFGLDKDTRDKIDAAIASTNEFIVEAGTNTTVSKDDKEVGKIKYTVDLKDTLTDINSITSKKDTNLTFTRNAGSSILLSDTAISLTAGNGADAKTIILNNDGRLSGISEGTEDTDAVNLGQLNSKLAPIQQINQDIRNEMKEISLGANAGIASAIAAANLPQAINSSARNVFGLAVGNYANGNSIAMGYSGTNKSRSMVWKLSGTYNSDHKVGLGAGIGFTFGIKDMKPKDNSAMEEIKELKNTIAEMKEQYEERIAKLEKMLLELKK